MIKLIRATSVLENCPSARFILLNKAYLMELFNLLFCELSVATMVLFVVVRNVEFHQSVLVQVLLPLIGRPLIQCITRQLQKFTKL